MNRKITLLLSLLLLGLYFPSWGQAPITGTLTLCAGATTNLSDTDPAGTWSSATTGVATVDPYLGIVYGVGPGTSVITYATSTTAVTATVVVGPPGPISGLTVVCVGSTITLSDPTPAGSWSSSGAEATVDPLTGVVTGVSPTSSSGITITYTNDCGHQDYPITVLPVITAFTSTVSSVCSGAAIVVTDAVPGGTWSSSNPTTASVSGGIVTGGTTPGTATITYANGCSSTSLVVTVLAKPTSIVGVTSFCFSSSSILASTPTGGTWSTSDASIATVVPTTGIITAGTAAGSAAVTYTIPDGCFAVSGVVVNNCPPCPPNSDLELGDFSNWQFFTGTCCPGGAINATTPTSTPPAAGLIPLAFALTGPTGGPSYIIGNTNDPFGGFNVVGNGVYSLRIGSCRSNNWAEKAVYYVHVPTGPGAYSLIYRYACVIEDPGHSASEQPRFTVQAYDSTSGAIEPCADFLYVPSGGIPGFIGYMGIGTGTGASSAQPCLPTLVPPVGPRATSGAACSGCGSIRDVWYKDWATTSINLSGLGGHTIRMEFAAGGCQLGGHFAYGYVDMTCGTFAIASLGCGDSIATVTAPSGFANYSWYDSLTFDTLYGTTQTTTFTMPTHPTTYAVVMTPYPHFGCPDTLYTRISPSNLQVHPNPDTMLCVGHSTTISAGATDIALPLTYSWTPATTLSCATCATPIATPHAGVNVYTVVVTDDAGCQKTTTQRVRVDSVAISVANTPTSCFHATDGTATATPTAGISPYTYSWGLVPVQTTPTAINLAVGSVFVTVTDSALCTATGATTITQPPPLTMAIGGTQNPTTCGGNDGQINLTGFPASVPAGGITIRYLFTATASTATTAVTITAGTDATGLLIIGGLSQGYYDSITVVVVPPACPYNEVGPVTLSDPPPPALPFVGSNSPVCVGPTNVINLTTTDVTPGVTYTWNGPGGFMSTSQTPTISPVVFADSGWYKVTVEVNNCFNKDSTWVVIHNVTPPQVSNNTPVCSETDTVKFLSSPTPPYGADAYLWNGPNSYLSNLQNPYIPNAPATVAGVYTITITFNGCTASSTTTVVINQSPDAPVVRDTNYCQFDFPPAYLAPELTAVGDNLKWYPTATGGTPLGGAPTPSTEIAQIKTWYVTQTTSTVPACTSPRAAISVGVYTLPDPKFIITDSVFCAGTAFTFNLSNYNTGVDYQGITWGFGPGDSTQNVNPIIHGFNTPGPVTVTANVYYNVCPDATLTRNVMVYDFPSLHLGGDTAICPGGEAIKIGDHYNADASDVTWLWNTGETTPYINVVAPGVFYLKATTNGCSTTDTITVANDCYMNIPNIFTPNGDGVNDYFYPRQFLTRGLSSFSMNIYNRWGQLVFTSNSIEGRGWDGNFNDIPQPEGVFIYIIDATFKDGQKEHHQGNITLLR